MYKELLEKMRKKYDGKPLENYKRIDEISYLNSDYYIGELNTIQIGGEQVPYKHDLIWAECDDDNTRRIFLVREENVFKFGVCWISEEDIIHVDEYDEDYEF